MQKTAMKRVARAEVKSHEKKNARCKENAGWW